MLLALMTTANVPGEYLHVIIGTIHIDMNGKCANLTVVCHICKHLLKLCTEVFRRWTTWM